MRRYSFVLMMGLASCVSVSSGAPNLLRNSGFETVPGAFLGQGLLPSEFATSAGPFLVGADTYSNDGSFGLSPGEFGNFPGILAHEGIRFVAAGDLGGPREAFGQQLSQTLAPGGRYDLSAFVLLSPRFGVNGGFEVLLSPSISVFEPGITSVGFLPPTSATSEWQGRTLSFSAPVNAGSLPFIIFSPVAATTGSVTYVALDAVSLSAVPEVSSSVAIAGAFLGGVALKLRKRAARV